MRHTESSLHPALRSIVVEATEALARLDAERLEELVLSCQKLNREFSPHSEAYNAASASSLLAQGIPPSQSQLDQSQMRIHLLPNTSPEMAIFSRLLGLTRENLAVLA